MTHFITDKCTLCGKCQQVCPVECIVKPKDLANNHQFYIDPDTCIDCGACVPECEPAAIFSDQDDTSTKVSDLSKNKDFFANGPGYSDQE